jgi:sensor c-di-GMP phosphodiesterase-like protein
LDHIIPLSAGGSSEPDNLRLVCPQCNASLANRVFAFASSPSTEAAKLWIRAFDKNAAWTLAGTAAAFLSAAIGIAPWYMKPAADHERPFAEQIRQLDATEQSLRQLSGFIQSQRQQLTQDKETLARLQNERKSLEPVVAAQREAVDAIFRAQEARSAARAGRERWIGFGLGVLSSLLASAVVAVLRYLYLRRKLSRSANN